MFLKKYFLILYFLNSTIEKILCSDLSNEKVSKNLQNYIKYLNNQIKKNHVKLQDDD